MTLGFKHEPERDLLCIFVALLDGDAFDGAPLGATIAADLEVCDDGCVDI